MKSMALFTLLFVLSALTADAQHHEDSWVHESATDTTIVRCWNDSLTSAGFPPGSMTGMMFPDSIYCRIDKLHLDSLVHPHDSTYVGWYRMQIGRDSMNFDMMNDSMMGGNHMMQFMSDLSCQLHWDSSMTDSAHSGWHPTEVHAWNGSAWVPMSGVTFEDGIATFTVSRLYSAYAFVGSPGGIVGVEGNDPVIGSFRLNQNYPNPFNPSTNISYVALEAGYVSLTVYDMLGREVISLVNGRMDAGSHSILWSAEGVPSGVYVYRIMAGEYSEVRKMVLMK